MINIVFGDSRYEDVQEISIGENMVAVNIDSEKAEVYVADDIDVLILDKDTDDQFENVDSLIDDIRRLCSLYGYEVTDHLAGIDDGQLQIRLGINLFEI